MISRRTTRVLGELFAQSFYTVSSVGSGYQTRSQRYVANDQLYDFLFERDYAAYFCNAAKKLGGHYPRALKEFVMKLHTGETLVTATSNWVWEQREKLGQRYLRNLCEDILVYWDGRRSDYDFKECSNNFNELKRSVELDGYQWKNGKLLASEADVLDVTEETGLLQSLYTELVLSNSQTAFHHLQLSEEHYLAARWDDCISNSRKFLECVLQESAATHSRRILGVELAESTFSRPVEVRRYLEREGMLEAKEREAVQAVYGLLSHTGGHPYMAQNDQARLLRHLALTFSQFVMLRLKGSLVKC